MTNQQTKEQENLEREFKQLTNEFDKTLKKVGYEMLAKSIRESARDDSNKIYWKG